MYCPQCGADGQAANAYCKRCGEWLRDIKSLTRRGFGGDTPEQKIFTTLFLSALSAAAALFSAAALYATHIGGGKWSVYFAAAFCLCIAGWQATNFVVGLKLRRRFRRGRADTAPALEVKAGQAALNQANTSRFVKTQSVTENTTDLLEPVERALRQKEGR